MFFGNTTDVEQQISHVFYYLETKARRKEEKMRRTKEGMKEGRTEGKKEGSKEGKREGGRRKADRKQYRTECCRTAYV